MKDREQMARMGEYAVSRDPEGVLVALGLGSCIGLALIDRRRRVAGLAHIVLPSGAGASGEPPVKYAPKGVGLLLERVIAQGARRSRLEAVLVGGASMFSTGSAMEVGQRNEEAVRTELERARIPVAASATGGSRGRTIRVHVGDGRVVSRVAGGEYEVLLGALEEVAA